MFIILLVATATLDGLLPYWTVLNCFHLLWTIVFIYFELFWYILLGWFYHLIIVLIFKLFIFKLRTLFSLQYYCVFASSHQLCIFWIKVTQLFLFLSFINVSFGLDLKWARKLGVTQLFPLLTQHAATHKQYLLYYYYYFWKYLLYYY